MKVYLGAAFSRQAEMRGIADALEVYGVFITSRWLLEDQKKGTHKYLRECAFTDIEDVESSDIFVRFTDDLSLPDVPSSLATGSRMFEMGLAWKAGIPIVVVGGHQPVFDHLPNITHLKDEAELIRYLSSEEIN